MLSAGGWVAQEDLQSLEVAEAEQEQLNKKSAVAATWQSGGRLGGRDKNDLKERSIFAERWERMVTTLLYMPGASGMGDGSSRYRQHSTVSFRTADYVYKAPASAGGAGG